MRVGQSIAVVFCCLFAGGVLAFPSVPRESANALGVTKGKSIETGIVFVNGKYIPAPYVVSRWGTGLRINGRKVSGQIVDWSEFVKTQAGAKAVKTVTSDSNSPVELAPEPGSDADDSDSSIDDLFDDGKKTGGKNGKARSKRRQKPRESVSYSFDGDFTPNAETKALVERINAARSEIDRQLRLGGFLCFGDGYARITGDSRTAQRFIETVPALMKNCTTSKDLAAAVRSSGLEYLNEGFCEDLFRNRIDYRVLQERAERMKTEANWRKSLEKSGTSSY